MDIKRVGIYARVSTKDQTTENQLLDLRKYCDSRGWKIVAECIDQGLSGTKDDRPQLKAVMGLARKRKIDVLLVWRFDRFARSLTNLVNSLDELRGLGVDFASYQENIDTTSAQGKMLFGIFASIAEFERALIVERINAGLRRARSQGKRFGRPSGIVDASKVLELRDQKLSMREIALQIKASKSAVARLLSRNGGQIQGIASVGA